jgi:hypothetical protein
MIMDVEQFSVDTIDSVPPQKTYENPYWSNKETRHLIVTIVRPDGKTKNIASIMDPNGTNPDMKAVLAQYTEEDIDKNTQAGLDRRNDNIKKQMERRESQNARAKQEGLFACKLEAFEIEGIKNSKDIEMKKMIRKAKSPMEVNAYATILLMRDLGLVINVQ